jgi:GT2 family glycosyltransferase
VVAHDPDERLVRTLEALACQTQPPAETIVVHSGSCESADRVLASFPHVRVHRLPSNRGPSVARNTGLRQAATELVLLLDHDIYLAPDCLEQLALARGRWDATAACPRIRLHPARDIVQADGAEPHFIGALTLRHGFRRADQLAPADPAPVGGALSACLLVARDRVLAAGGFDELIFFYFEDLEFSLRLRALGHEFVAAPDAEAFHDRRAGTPGLGYRGTGRYPPQRFELTLRHRLLVLLVHYRLRTLVVLAPALAAYEAAGFLLALRRGLIAEWLRAWGWPLRHRSAIRERRRRMQRARVQRDRDLLSGGPLPLAPGVVEGPAAGAARFLSALLDGYWRVARRWMG